jgi:glutamate synthase domain-containing protein 2
VRAVGGRCEVYLDGGIRGGTDILKALALGARAVFVGRPTIYGLAYDVSSFEIRYYVVAACISFNFINKNRSKIYNYLYSILLKNEIGVTSASYY